MVSNNVPFQNGLYKKYYKIFDIRYHKAHKDARSKVYHFFCLGRPVILNLKFFFFFNQSQINYFEIIHIRMAFSKYFW